MKYIGVRGHRGAGKISISYLLGNTLEYLIKNKGVIQDDYNTLYANLKQKSSKLISNQIKK